MRHAFRSHPFLLIGLVTYALFLTVETLGPEAQASAMARLLTAGMRVLIIPMYVGWLLVTIVAVQLLGPTPTGASALVFRFLQLAFGFAPYLLADVLLRRFRTSVGAPAA